MPGLSVLSRLQAGSAAGSDGQRVALLVANTGSVVEPCVAGEVVAYVADTGIVGDRVFPAVWSHHLLSGYASQTEYTYGYEVGSGVAVAAVATTVPSGPL